MHLIQKYRFGKERYIKQNNDYLGVTKNNEGVRWKKAMSKKYQGLQRRRVKRRN